MATRPDRKKRRDTSVPAPLPRCHASLPRTGCSNPTRQGDVYIVCLPHMAVAFHAGAFVRDGASQGGGRLHSSSRLNPPTSSNVRYTISSSCIFLPPCSPFHHRRWQLCHIFADHESAVCAGGYCVFIFYLGGRQRRQTKVLTFLFKWLTIRERQGHALFCCFACGIAVDIGLSCFFARNSRTLAN